VSVPGEERLIGFHLGGAGAALPLAIVREVTERPRVVRVPGTHPFVSGVALRGGMALPVYDLCRLESLWPAREHPDPKGRPADADRLIVCDWGEIALGLLGGGVDLVEDGGEEGEETRCGMSGDFVKRVLRVHGETIALLDPERLFTSLGVPAAEPRVRRETGEDDPAGG
jgi:chemotaxis signal transduction protein